MNFSRFFRKIRKRVSRKYKDIDPEDIFFDSTNRVYEYLSMFTFLN